ncbi:hypothetical protein [Stenotrophomonas sp. PS02289]|uniref:hypothetical protein n=1 Tax=Stenotrophomonas sp. PS02289 TaxID=2991422 RepID=UPI00249C5948|nr:hypothetical protein [Stenotrophomonas sp. PS02289]
MRQIGIGFVVLLGLTACSNPGDFDSDQGLLREFKYLGCEGDWEDESYAPEVLRKQEGILTTYLVRSADTCGYDQGMDAKASLSGETIKLSYRLATSNEEMAACYCEYRARFIIATPTSPITTVEVNGDEARLRDGEAFR